VTGTDVHIPTLTTERLTLRAPALGDHAAYAAFWASERSAIVGGPHETKVAWFILTDDAGHWALRGFGVWAVDDGTGCVGTVGFRLPIRDVPMDVELGWTLFSGTGRGFATEAARAALAWARETGHAARWGRIVSYIDRANAPSQAVAARLGARDTGQAAAHNPDCDVWEHPLRGVAA
jgi:RimJ/RimL family protein N-acetyltransferase